MTKYLQIFKTSWQQNLEFRGMLLTRLLISMIALISVFYLWNDVFQSRTSLAGYSKEQMITYYLVIGYILSSIFVWPYIDKNIREGELSSYLTKPVSYLAWVYWDTLARRVFRLLLGLPVLILIFTIFREHLFLQTDPMAYLYLILTCLGAINILFLLDAIIGSIEFWVLHSDSLNMIFGHISGFFAGTLIPIALLPRVFIDISAWLPFQYTGYFIVNSFLGRLSALEVLAGIGIQLIWTVILALLLKMIWSRGLKRYEAFGN